MKIKITRGRLQDALKRVSGVADGRTSLPILANVKMTANKEGLTLLTSNLDITMSTKVTECEVIEEGETTAPMRKLEQIVSVLPSESVELESNEKENVRLVSGGVKMSVLGLPASDFPVLAEMKNPVTYSLKGAAFADVLRKSAYAMSKDDTRRTLKSVLLVLDGKTIVAVGTDGRRLGKGEAECVAEGVEKETEYVVPDTAVAILQRIVDTGADITIKACDGQFSFSQCDGRDFIHTKLVDGQYPNYKQVIPAKGSADIAVDRNEMLAMLNRSLVMVTGSDPYVNLKFGANTIDLTADGEDGGKIHDTIPARYSGKEISISFNPRYLMDCLKSLDSDIVELNTDEEAPHRPIIINGEAEKGMAIVMPLRIA